MKQTVTDFELILVDDGSTDGCFGIMKKYAKQDIRIVTVHQENQGVSAARNAGLRIAKGKYIGFVDPDDWIEENMYEKLLEGIRGKSGTLVYCNHDFVRESGEIALHNIDNCPLEMNKQQFVKHMLSAEGVIGGTVCNALFAKSLIEKEFEESLEIGEDAVFIANYLQNVNEVQVIKQALYHVFERSDSATRKNPEKVSRIVGVKYKLMKMYESQLLGREKREIHKYGERSFLDSCFYYMNWLKMRGGYYDTVRKDFMDYMRKNFIRVLFNNKLYWKTRVIYIVQMLKHLV